MSKILSQYFSARKNGEPDSLEQVQRLRNAYRFYANRVFHISLKNKYVYAQTPKVASSTLNSRLIDLEIQRTRIDKWTVGIHPDVTESVHVKVYQLPDDLLHQVFYSGDYTIFTFVRNPYDRLLSAYLDKIVRFEPEGLKFRQYHNFAPDSEVSFREFVMALHNNRNNSGTWDPHWRPQTKITRPDLVPYTLIGKLEKFDEDFERLDELLGGVLGTYKRLDPHKTDARSKIAEHYDRPLLDAVSEIYSDDFRAFSYEPE